MKRRERPPPPPDEVSDEQAAQLWRDSVPAGWRFDGPEFAGMQHAVVQILAHRWRRGVEWEDEHGAPPRSAPWPLRRP